ncbi:DUF4259 domain-containing protein [Ascidiaceihabitans sp.]|uniref:DUF4259 domain-containing protein n=1 Tax=Ascidiaceihabitans sp. TaxID=1872644 RepID=UPI00329888B4
MGAWGVSIFEDDTSLDWIEDDYTSGGVEAVRGALTVAVETTAGDTLDYDEGIPARVAAEIVAVCFGAAHPGMGTDNSETLLEHIDDVTQDRDLIPLALQALARVNADNSELQELWAEGDQSAWDAEIEGLEIRLRGLT